MWARGLDLVGCFVTPARLRTLRDAFACMHRPLDHTSAFPCQLCASPQIRHASLSREKRPAKQLMRARLRRRRGARAQARLAAAVGPTEVECVDCARDSAETLAAAVRRADCVWVSGGNTFFLWHHMQQSGMDEMVKAHVRKGALYVGCSAGAAEAAGET
eukprot:3961461-Pleurochrysis_carterae.AAC.1